MQEKRRKAISALFALAALAVGSGDALAGWSVTDLGTWGQLSNVAAVSINNSSQIAGAAIFGSDIDRHATIWSNGTAYDLGSPGVLTSAGSINDSGVVAGITFLNSQYGGSGGAPYATVWENGAPRLITPTSVYFSDGPFAGAGYIAPSGMNNAAQVVGMSVSTSDPNRAAIWQNGTVEALASPTSGDNSAAAINNLGQIVGYSTNAAGNHQAAFWTSASATSQNLGTTWAAYESFAFDINDNGQIVGEFTHNGSSYTGAVLWTNGTATLLPGFSDSSTYTYAKAISNTGVVVGTCGSSAVMWQDGVITDLNDLVAGTGWRLTASSDVNDLGQIIGAGYNPQGVLTSFLLTPTPTPIPAALPLFGSALAALAAVRRRYVKAQQF